MPDPLHPDRLVSFKDLQAVFALPFSRQHLMRLVRAGNFPRHMKLSARRIAWRYGDVSAWINTRDKARR